MDARIARTSRMYRRLALLLSVFPAFALGAPGDLDPAFGNGGSVVATDVAVDYVGGLAVQPDGRLVVAGSRAGFAEPGALYLVGYTADGRRDSTFGGGGVVTVSGEFSPALAIDADGTLLVASTRCDPTGCVAKLNRYTADGELDPTFVAPDRDAGAPTVTETVALQPDGKILVGGNDGHAPGFGVWLARYNADGTNDPSFGENGIAGRNGVSPHGSSLDSVLVRADGSILAGVTGGTGEGVFGDLEQFTALGADVGAFATPFGYPLLARAPDGGTLVVGTLYADPNPGEILLARFDDALHQDPAFAGGSNGPTGSAHDALVDPDGRIVVAAASGAGTQEFAVFRFTTGGMLDASFGAGGLATVAPDSPGIAYRALREPDGKIVAAGVIGGALALARLYGDSSATTTTTVPSATTTTTTSPAGSTGDTPGIAVPPAACAAGCACLEAPGECTGTPARLTLRLTRACALLARAADVTTGERRLGRRAMHLVRLDRRAMTRLRAARPTCVAALAADLDAIESRARGFLGAR
ncbi:MAG TPA: hypothetical protein VKU61_00245 [Candidatus Binatia bacterium]|nr:hypothetical protein [Candidatus Binatia bacterium]